MAAARYPLRSVRACIEKTIKRPTAGQRYNMAVEAMAKPLNKIKKIRSLDEIITRGGQAISVYREQRRGGRDVPTDDEFVRLIDAGQFGTAPVIAESLWQKFYKNGRARFFPVFRQGGESAKAFREIFGDAPANRFIKAAENIVDGRIDLLGLKNLYVGTEIDWHREPLSAKRSPLKHWKQFDDLDSTETGNKKIIWELNRHQHFFTLGAAFWLSGDERFARVFADQLDQWMDQNPPGIGINWSSSLEVAFRAMSWIWAFHFFEESDALTPGLFKKALGHLYLHGRHIEQYLSKYYSPNTHLTGEALALYYLGSQLPFFERSGQWRKLGEDILFAEISKQVLPDGVYFEQSTWYQRYTADFFAHFVVLRSLSGEPCFSAGAARLETSLETAFDFLMRITLPGGKTPVIGDDDGGRTLPFTSADPDDFRGTLALGAFIFDRGDHKYVAGPVSEEVFWLAGVGGVKSYNAIKEHEPTLASMDFADGGYFVMRDGWTDTDNYLVVDCGELGAMSGGHGHADALSVELAMRGRTLLVDSGTYTYHESREMRDYFRSTVAHNTLVIDSVSSSEPASLFNWKTRAITTRTAWISEGRFDLFEGSHDGYQRLADAATHTRSILFLKNDYWIMRDLVETAGEHEYSLNFHFDAEVKPAIGEDGLFVGDDDHRLFTFGDNGAWQQKESWISNNHGKKMNAPFLRFMSTGKGTQEFFTFILPVDRGYDPPDVSEIDADAGRAFVIKYGPYTDVFFFNDAPGMSIDNGIFESNFRYSWARLAPGESLPDELVLIDGDRLRLGDCEVLAAHDANYASIRRLGRELYLKTDLGRAKKTL